MGRQGGALTTRLLGIEKNDRTRTTEVSHDTTSSGCVRRAHPVTAKSRKMLDSRCPFTTMATRDARRPVPDSRPMPAQDGR